MKMLHQLNSKLHLLIVLALLFLCLSYGLVNFSGEENYFNYIPFVLIFFFIIGFGLTHLILRLTNIKSKRVLLIFYYFFLINSLIAMIAYPFQSTNTESLHLIVLAYITVIPSSLGLIIAIFTQYKKNF